MFRDGPEVTESFGRPHMAILPDDGSRWATLGLGCKNALSADHVGKRYLESAVFAPSYTLVAFESARNTQH
jgi:hypothetical protein